MKRYFFLLLVLVSFSTCDDDDDITIENPEEVITNLTLVLTPAGGTGTTVTLAFADPDGDGGNAPVITSSGPLMANTTYSGLLGLVNASDPNDPEDISAEVREEDEEHQVFYLVGGGLNLEVSYAGANDENGNPVGLLTEMVTGDASSGTLEVILVHEPDKSAAGISIGNPDPAGGETDIEVRFDVEIQ